jgi:5'-nucleotidase
VHAARFSLRQRVIAATVGSPMRILLTNDDGYDAPGLLALFSALRDWPDVELTVIAPAEPRSGIGHAVSPSVRWRQRDADGIGAVYAVDGTPADCVRVARELTGQPWPDRVISGINRGSNLGVDIYPSGTVAAAREAAIHGIPAVAVSQLVKTDLPDDWARTRREAAAVLAALIRPDDAPPPDADTAVHAHTLRALRDAGVTSAPPDPRAYWNVNLPRLPAGTPISTVALAPVSTDPLPLAYRAGGDADGGDRLEYTGAYHDRAAAPGTDVGVVFGGAVCLTRLMI